MASFCRFKPKFEMNDAPMQMSTAMIQPATMSGAGVSGRAVRRG
jgi:hypothetical protein